MISMLIFTQDVSSTESLSSNDGRITVDELLVYPNPTMGDLFVINKGITNDYTIAIKTMYVKKCLNDYQCKIRFLK